MDYVQSFAEFGNVLQGCLLSDWKQILSDHFPELATLETVLLTHDRSSAENFTCVINLFLQQTLNEKKPRDRQNIYMAPGGDYGIHKDLMTQPLDHLHLGWQCRQMCLLSATSLKQQTFLSVVGMLEMSSRHVGDILLCRPIFWLSASCR